METPEEKEMRAVIEGMMAGEFPRPINQIANNYLFYQMLGRITGELRTMHEQVCSAESDATKWRTVIAMIKEANA